MQAQSRVALYWTPASDDPLCTAGNTWLGRDPERGVAVPQPVLPGLAALTAAPRLYGFHATLRPPMRLATGWEDFVAAAAGAIARIADFTLPSLEVTALDGFLALCPSHPCPRLNALADECVRATDPHRLRPEAAELAARRGKGLSALEDALLLRWGYPHVMERWRFHMTLTRRLDDSELSALRPAAERHFAAALSRARKVSDVAIFTQMASGDTPSAFLVGDRLKLLG